MSESPIIEVRALTKNFGSFCAVDHISFTVEKGEIFGFLGANGAGKTTAMRMLTGLLKPTSGIGRVAGYDITNESELVKKNIGYMSQKFSLYEDLTILENMELYGGIYGMKLKQIHTQSESILNHLNLFHNKDQRVGSLPLGWKQKLAFSVAMFHNPSLVFLDEPTSGVDPVTRREFWSMIYSAAHHGTTVFITTHYLDEAEYCNRVSIMVDGVIRAMDTPAALRKAYGVSHMEEVFIQCSRNAQRSEGT